MIHIAVAVLVIFIHGIPVYGSDDEQPSTMPSIAPSLNPTSPPSITPTLVSMNPSVVPSSSPIDVLPPVTDATPILPAIMCESFALNLDTQEIGCPSAYKYVTVAVGHVLNMYTYENQLILPTEASAYPDTIKRNKILPLLGECEVDCDVDDDCAPGLLCADAHKDELRMLGYDDRRAYCPANVGGGYDEVCFRKELLNAEEQNRLLSTVEEQGIRQDERQLGCGQCLPYCDWRPRAPACIVLGCEDCRRRRSRNLEETQPEPSLLDLRAMANLATAQLRIISSWENITDYKCKVFLETATCFADTDDWVESSSPSVNPTDLPSSSPVTTTSKPSLVPSVNPTDLPSSSPVTTTSKPSLMPTITPSFAPSLTPTITPTGLPSKIPSSFPVYGTVDGNETTSVLPPIKCESFSVPDQPDQVACPNSKELVEIAVGHALNDLAYQNEWIASTETSVYPDTIKNDTVLPRLGECKWDCDVDSDCAPGLVCTEQYMTELKAKGLSQYKARCNKNDGRAGPPRQHVCFRKQILNRSSYRFLRGDVDEIEEESSQDHRELKCSWKCLSICKNSKAPACIVLDCDDQCDRRRERSLSLDKNGQRTLQQGPTIDVDALLTVATTELRKLASSSIISVDDAVCRNFLSTATCSVDTATY